MKLQHFSCSAGPLVQGPPGRHRRGEAAHPSAQSRHPRRHGRTGRGQGQARKKASRGDLLNPRCSAIPAAASFPRFWKSGAPGAGPCSGSARGRGRTACVQLPRVTPCPAGQPRDGLLTQVMLLTLLVAVTRPHLPLNLTMNMPPAWPPGFLHIAREWKENLLPQSSEFFTRERGLDHSPFPSTCAGKKKQTSQDNLLTQITFHSYLMMLLSHTDKLLARLPEPCKGPPHEFSDSVETCQCPFLYLTKQPQQGKLWCKAHLFCKVAPFVSALP